MALYESRARSNYFKVKDLEKFKEEFINKLPYLELIANKEGLVGFMVDNNEGGIPHQIYSENWPDTADEDIDFDKLLSEHLVEGSIAVYQEVGFEKLKYLSGFATAVNHKGETVHLSLCDIYEKAGKAFGEKSEITACEY